MLSELSCNARATKVVQSCFVHQRHLSKIKSFLSSADLENVIDAFISSWTLATDISKWNKRLQLKCWSNALNPHIKIFLSNGTVLIDGICCNYSYYVILCYVLYLILHHYYSRFCPSFCNFVKKLFSLWKLHSFSHRWTAFQVTILAYRFLDQQVWLNELHFMDPKHHWFSCTNRSAQHPPVQLRWIIQEILPHSVSQTLSKVLILGLAKMQHLFGVLSVINVLTIRIPAANNEEYNLYRTHLQF